MSDMKCPFCGQTIACTDTQDADEYATWFCPRCVAERNWYAFGNEKLWQEFLRTRKALDVAKDTIRHADWFFDGDYNVDAKTMHSEIKCAIKGITALEQKDVK